MALNYTNLFTRKGKLVGRANSYAALATTTLPADLLAILTTFGTYEDPIEGVVSQYGTFKDNITSWRQYLAGLVDNVMLDRELVLKELGLVDADIATAVFELVRRMALDSQTIKPNVVSTGTVTANADNVGNGTVLLTTVLDGYSSPGNTSSGQPMPAHPNYNGLTTQLCMPSETMELTCVADSMQDGTDEGAEQFVIEGGPTSPDQGYLSEGSGAGPNITVMNGDTTVPLTNLNFENFTSNVPDGWTIAQGTAGTHVIQDTTNFYRGTSALRITGAGGQGTIQLTQALAPSGVKAQRRYCLSVRARRLGVVTTGDLRIQFTGTGYTASASERVLQTISTLGATYTLLNFFINLPDIIPSDWTLDISVINTLSAGGSVLIDSMAFAPVTYFGGLGLVLVAGSTRFVKHDRFTWSVSNDGAGLFQSFYRRHYGVQLPSNASPSISDALVS